MPYGVVYKITNIYNGKIYVGQTIRRVEERWKSHIRDSNKPLYPIQHAIQKYGKNNFLIEVICECATQEDLNEKENYFAHQLNSFCPNGYNLRAGDGSGSMSESLREHMSIIRQGVGNPNFGKTTSQETRDKMSKSHRGEKSYNYGKTQSLETKQKNALAHLGRHHTKEARVKISLATRRENNPNYGKHHSLDTKEKISKSSAKTYHFVSPEEIQITITNLREFCTINNLCYTSMNKVANGKQASYKGWTKTHVLFSID